MIETVGDTVLDTIPVGASPQGIAVHPDGSRVYVANKGDGTLSVIDVATRVVIDTIAVGLGPQMVAVAPDGGHAYVSNRDENTVDAIDLATGTVIDTVPVDVGPLGLQVHPDGDRLYVAHALDGTVVVLDLPTHARLATIPAGNSPHAWGDFITRPEVDPIGGVATDLTLQRVLCRNLSTGGSTLAQVDGPAWDCTAGGLEASPGDQVMQQATGRATCGGEGLCAVGGEVTGMAPQTAVCRNETTGDSIVVQLDGDPEWDCVAAGLAVLPGDRMRMIVRGPAE